MTDETEKSSPLSREKLITWALNLATTIALSVGAYFFNDLTHKMERLNSSLNKLEAGVAVLEASVARQQALETRVHVLETQGSSPLRAQIEAILERIRLLEQQQQRGGGR